MTRTDLITASCSLGLVACLTGAAAAAETKPFVCIDVVDTGAGVDPDGLAAAIRLEARKAEAEVAVRVVGPKAPCPTRGRLWVRVGPGPAAEIAASQRSQRVPLDAIPAAERAAELAWAVIDFGVPELDPSEPEQLVDTDDDVWIPAPAVDVAAASVVLEGPSRRTLGFEVWAEGGYGFQPQGTSHRGTLGGEFALALFDSRLTIGAAGGYRAAATVAVSDVEVSRQSGELLGVVRGGLWAGPVLLRLGLQAGWQWRTLEAGSPTRSEEMHGASGAGVLGGDVEALWAVTDALMLGVAVRGRGYLGGSEYTFDGDLVAPAPAGELGVVLRVGVSLWP